MTHHTSTAARSASPPPQGGPGTASTMGVGGLALALTIALTTQATAQIIPTGTPAADIVLTQGIADWRVFVTCSALDTQANWHVVNELYHDITAASAILTANNVPDALSPDPDTPFGNVLELCLAHPDWSDRCLDRKFTFLERDLAKAFP